MNNEQITSNLGELIKNQIEICEKLDKIGKQIKKIGKPKNQPYFLGDFITDKYFDPKFHQWNDLKSELQKMLSE